MTRAAFENAIVTNSAIGGSTNAPIHINAIAQHAGVDLDINDWQSVGHDVPLLVNMQPAGEYLGEAYYEPAECRQHGRTCQQRSPQPRRETANGKTLGENLRGKVSTDRRYPRLRRAMMDAAGFVVLSGNLFDAAVMKTSVISEEPGTISESAGDETPSRSARSCLKDRRLSRAHQRPRASDRCELRVGDRHGTDRLPRFS